MDLLFKFSNTGGNRATVGNTNFREHYAAINANTDWAVLVPAIRQATEEYLLPALGRTIYVNLAAKYVAGTSMNDDEKRILEIAQDVAALYSIMNVSPELLLSISEMGLVDKGSAGAPTYPTPQWRFKTFKWELAKKADQALDRLIAELERLSIGPTSTFKTWREQTEYQNLKTYFFSTAAQFSEFVNINNSRRIFQSLRDDIVRQEDRIVRLICDDQFSRLTTMQNPLPELNSAEKGLLTRIRRYVAAKAVSEAAHINFTLNGQGLMLSSYTDGIDQHQNAASVVHGTAMLGAFMLQLQKNAQVYWDELVNYIYSNIADLPLIAQSDCYASMSGSHIMPICTGPGGVMI